MPNFIEKRLPIGVRKNFKTAIVGGVSFFIALMYSDFFKKLIDTYLPNTDGLIARGILLVAITIGFAFLLAGIDKFLDGK